MSPTSTLRCAGCGEALDPGALEPWRCPRANDGGAHVLRVDLDLQDDVWPGSDEPHPYKAWAPLLHASRVAPRLDLAPGAFERAVVALDEAIAHTVGHGLERAPLIEAPALRDDLGVARVWILDATRQPGGTHKIRHLFGVALWLELTATDKTVPLAIASCGNAALSAAIVARALDRDLEVFVPMAAHEPILRQLRELGAHVRTCERGPGERGDPCLRHFRAAVERGAVPFSVQGPDNGLTVEGGRTLAWDLVDALRKAEAGSPDAIFVQVGGGALASAMFQGLEVARELGAIERLPRLHSVQTAAVHPLERAWRKIVADILRATEVDTESAPAPQLARQAARLETASFRQSLDRAAAGRAGYMWPWETAPTSVADAILDDETYDWLEVCRGMLMTGGWPVAVDELTLVEARELAVVTTGIEVSHTGSAGLAGALVAARAGELDPDDEIALLFTG